MFIAIYWMLLMMDAVPPFVWGVFFASWFYHWFVKN